METLELNTIKKEITIVAGQQTAFEVFVNQMSLWWPASGHTDDCPMVRVGLEPKPGGRWFGALIYLDSGEDPAVPLARVEAAGGTVTLPMALQHDLPIRKVTAWLSIQ